MSESPSKRARTEEPAEEGVQALPVQILRDEYGRKLKREIIEIVTSETDPSSPAVFKDADLDALDPNELINVAGVKKIIRENVTERKRKHDDECTRHKTAQDAARAAVTKVLSAYVGHLDPDDVVFAHVISKYGKGCGQSSVEVQFFAEFTPRTGERLHLSVHSEVIVGIGSSGELEYKVLAANARTDINEYNTNLEDAVVGDIIRRICSCIGVAAHVIPCCACRHYAVVRTRQARRRVHIRGRVDAQARRVRAP